MERGDTQVSFEEKMIFELSSGISLSGTKEVTVETKMCIYFHLLAILVDCDSECADRKFMLFERNACLMMMEVHLDSIVLTLTGAKLMFKDIDGRSVSEVDDFASQVLHIFRSK